MKTRTLGLLVLTACSADVAQTEGTGETASELNVKTSTLWPVRTIPTCLTEHGSIPPGIGYRSAALRAVADTWEAESAVVFGPCASGSHLDVTITQAAPDAVDAYADPPAATGTGISVLLPAVPASPAPSGGTTFAWTADRPELASLIARAYGRGLGFAPEDLRSDAPMRCGVDWQFQGTAPFGVYDAYSVTNRCGWNRWLSATDIDGVQRHYGAAKPFATSSFGNGLTSIFARGTDNTLQENWWNGSAWQWTSHGGNLGGGPAAVKIGATPHVFVRFADGSLNENYWTGSGWQWLSHGTPPSLGTMGTPSAVVAPNGNVHVFIRGLDHKLYDRKFNAAGGYWAWLTITSTPLASDPSATVTTNGNVFAFARTRNAGLVTALNTAEGLWNITEGLAGTVQSAPAAVAGGGVVKAFFRRPDGHLGEHWRAEDNSSSNDVDHGGGVRGVPSALTVTSVFIRGTDDRLYERWLDTNAGVWAWTPHGGPTLAASPTATSIDGTARVFVRNTQGGIDENYRVNWTWLWGGHPGTNKVP